MKISLKDISDFGLNIEKVVIPQEIGLKDDIFKCLIPLAIKARIEKVKDAVLAKVEVKGKYEFSCARCLELIIEERADQFDLYFELEPQTEQTPVNKVFKQNQGK